MKRKGYDKSEIYQMPFCVYKTKDNNQKIHVNFKDSSHQTLEIES
jgi:hypothetical protein